MKPNSTPQKTHSFSSVRLFGDGLSLTWGSGIILLGYFLMLAWTSDLNLATQAAQLRLQAEVDALNTVKQTMWLDEPADFIAQHKQQLQNQWAQFVEGSWLQGLKQHIQMLSLPNNDSSVHVKLPFAGELPQVEHQAQHDIKMGLLLLSAVIQILCIKVFELLLAIPLLLAALIIGVNEGALQRYIRRAGSGRESAYLFHQFSSWGYRGLKGCYLLFMLVPPMFAPQILVLPLAVTVGLVFTVVIGRFKKYV